MPAHFESVEPISPMPTRTERDDRGIDNPPPSRLSCGLPAHASPTSGPSDLHWSYATAHCPIRCEQCVIVRGVDPSRAPPRAERGSWRGQWDHAIWEQSERTEKEGGAPFVWTHFHHLPPSRLHYNTVPSTLSPSEPPHIVAALATSTEAALPPKLPLTHNGALVTMASVAQPMPWSRRPSFPQHSSSTSPSPSPSPSLESSRLPSIDSARPLAQHPHSHNPHHTPTPAEHPCPHMSELVRQLYNAYWGKRQ